MLIKLLRVASIAGCIGYLIRPRDAQGKIRARIEITGSHELAEFRRLADSQDRGEGRVADHIVVSHGSNCGSGWRTRADAIGKCLRDFLFRGLIWGVPWLRGRHTDLKGGFHDHYLFLRHHYPSGRQISLLPGSTDILHLQLFQTAQNARFGAVDPFDPAFRRQFTYLSPRLAPLDSAAAAYAAQELLRGALAQRMVSNNWEASGYLHGLGIRTRRTPDGLMLRTDSAPIRITTECFGQSRPALLAPGALRNWFTIADRELLEIANIFRAQRQLLDCPVFGDQFPSVFSEFGPYLCESKIAHETQNETPGRSQNIPSAEFGEDWAPDACDAGIDAKTRRNSRSDLAKQWRLIAAELAAWRARAAGSDSRIGRLGRRIGRTIAGSPTGAPARDGGIGRPPTPPAIDPGAEPKPATPSPHGTDAGQLSRRAAGRNKQRPNNNSNNIEI